MGGINQATTSNLLLSVSFQFSDQLAPPEWRGGGKDAEGTVTSSNMAAMTSATLDSVQKPGLLRRAKFTNSHCFSFF